MSYVSAADLLGKPLENLTTFLNVDLTSTAARIAVVGAPPRGTMLLWIVLDNFSALGPGALISTLGAATVSMGVDSTTAPTSVASAVPITGLVVPGCIAMLFNTTTSPYILPGQVAYFRFQTAFNAGAGTANVSFYGAKL